jgi:hypothetical protein
MADKKRKKKKTGIFESIRKPVAPPTRRFGPPKPSEKRMPSGRKSKHKNALKEQDADL